MTGNDVSSQPEHGSGSGDQPPVAPEDPQPQTGNLVEETPKTYSVAGFNPVEDVRPAEQDPHATLEQPRGIRWILRLTTVTTLLGVGMLIAGIIRDCNHPGERWQFDARSAILAFVFFASLFTARAVSSLTTRPYVSILTDRLQTFQRQLRKEQLRIAFLPKEETEPGNIALAYRKDRQRWANFISQILNSANYEAEQASKRLPRYGATRAMIWVGFGMYMLGLIGALTCAAVIIYRTLFLPQTSEQILSWQNFLSAGIATVFVVIIRAARYLLQTALTMINEDAALATASTTLSLAQNIEDVSVRDRTISHLLRRMIDITDGQRSKHSAKPP